MFVTSFVAANAVAGGTFSRIRTRLQPHFFRDSTSPGPALRPTHPLHASLVEFAPGHPRKDSQGRTATVSRDENLKAKSRAAAGESKEERKRERLSEPTRRILDAPDDALQSRRFSLRCQATRRMTRQVDSF